MRCKRDVESFFIACALSVVEFTLVNFLTMRHIGLMFEHSFTGSS